MTSIGCDRRVVDYRDIGVWKWFTKAMHQTEMQKYIAKIGESTVFVVKSVGTFRMETSRDEEVI